MLPYGLASASRIFTKLRKSVVFLLRRSEVRLIIYTDDILFMSGTHGSSKRHVHSTSFTRGLVVKLTKSHFTQSQSLEFLGFQVNTLILLQHKVKSIQDLYLQLMDQTPVTCTVRTWNSCSINKFSASIQGGFPVPLHCHKLQNWKNCDLQA